MVRRVIESKKVPVNQRFSWGKKNDWNGNIQINEGRDRGLRVKRHQRGGKAYKGVC